MANDKNIMRRGVQQALYKYLPGSWVDFTQSGGGTSYAVHVDRWNSVQQTNINSRRLLRVVNQKVNEFRNGNSNATANFSSIINEDNYYVLTPKVSDEERAIVTSVKPWVFVCTNKECKHVKQYYSYEDFKRNENKPCEICHTGHMTQFKMVRFCKCGYADGIYIPKCETEGHGTKYMKQIGSGVTFRCSKCGKQASPSFYCPECKQRLKTKSALDSSHFMPFTLSLIDLLDKRKDTLLENETNSRGEKLVIAHYLELVNNTDYSKIIEKGRITQEDEFEEALKEEAEALRMGGLDDATIALVLDAKRKTNPNNQIFESIDKVSQGISVINDDLLKTLAEEILEYDELIHAKNVLTLQEAEHDATLVCDGITPDYNGAAQELGFARVQMCSGVPIVFSAYGYTRDTREASEGAVLNGFPQEMDKRNIYATRLETEGVLFELDRRKIIQWLLDNKFITRLDLPQDMSDFGVKMWFLDRVHLDRVSSFNAIDDSDDPGRITKAIYTLLHSVSHALISEASEVCGLDKSSLSEYLLPNIPAVFVYCSNSQGFNMGALYGAFQTHFDRWLKHAKEHSQKCIFDPICIDKEKACTGCLFLNEVSCQHFNKDLDRSYLCGYYDKRKKEKITGFWEE